MLSIAIVCRDKSIGKQIKEYADLFFEQTGIASRVADFRDGDDMSFDYKPAFDVIFLDTQLKRMNCIETAAYIRTLDKSVNIVFLAGSADYAVQAFSVRAFDYLLKPVNYNDFRRVLEDVSVNAEQGGHRFVLISTDNGIVRLDETDIMFVESMNHKMIFHTVVGEYSTNCTMQSVESKLSQSDFFRCHNGYLVNLAYVKEVKSNTAEVGRHSLVISRAKRKAFLAAFKRYYKAD